jgi:hypothetical protein
MRWTSSPWPGPEARESSSTDRFACTGSPAGAAAWRRGTRTLRSRSIRRSPTRASSAPSPSSSRGVDRTWCMPTPGCSTHCCPYCRPLRRGWSSGCTIRASSVPRPPSYAAAVCARARGTRSASPARASSAPAESASTNRGISLVAAERSASNVTITSPVARLNPSARASPFPSPGCWTTEASGRTARTTPTVPSVECPSTRPARTRGTAHAGSIGGLRPRSTSESPRSQSVPPPRSAGVDVVRPTERRRPARFARRNRGTRLHRSAVAVTDDHHPHQPLCERRSQRRHQTLQPPSRTASAPALIVRREST